MIICFALLIGYFVGESVKVTTYEKVLPYACGIQF